MCLNSEILATVAAALLQSRSGPDVLPAAMGPMGLPKVYVSGVCRACSSAAQWQLAIVLILGC